MRELLEQALYAIRDLRSPYPITDDGDLDTLCEQIGQALDATKHEE